MERFPELGELAEVDAHVAVLVSGVDESLRLGVRHLPAHLADESDQLLGGDHTVTVSIEQFECLQRDLLNTDYLMTILGIFKSLVALSVHICHDLSYHDNLPSPLSTQHR